MDNRTLLDPIRLVFEEEMGDRLAGIYLHGSLAMGCFHPQASDIDLLVVAKETLERNAYRRIADRLMAIQDRLRNEGGIEVSIVLEKWLFNFAYPTPFEFHYSPTHRERYRTDADYLCGGFEDPDLAAHLTVTYHRGIALFGQPFREIYPPVERAFYVDSILQDVEAAAEEIAGNPIYYGLNLCRVLYYLREGVVASKKEGGEWGLSVLPAAYSELIGRMLREYGGLGDGDISDERQLREFAEYMLQAIRSEAGQKND
jgi:streptomycin 3"-adenylyltransferase